MLFSFFSLRIVHVLCRTCWLGEIAVQARASYLKPIADVKDIEMDQKILTVMNWASVGQSGAVSPPRLGGNGLATFGCVLSGSMLLYARNTTPKAGCSEVTLRDIRYFRGAHARDFKSIPDDDTWAGSLFGPGNQL